MVIEKTRARFLLNMFSNGAANTERFRSIIRPANHPDFIGIVHILFTEVQ